MNDWLERYRVVILSVIGLLIIGGIVVALIRWPHPAPIVIEQPPPTALPDPTATPSPIRVYVSGAVTAPDVYSLAPDAIAQDALEAAGGATTDADLDRINLAHPLHDGEQVYVPHIGEEPTPAPGATAVPTSPFPVNINTARLEELDAIPGVGPALAQRIIDYREANGPFQTIEEIVNVSGIGPSTFANMQDLITVGP